jgi:hypothetical protein
MELSSAVDSRRAFFGRRRRKKGKMFSSPIYTARPASRFSPQADDAAKEITPESSDRDHPAGTSGG